MRRRVIAITAILAVALTFALPARAAQFMCFTAVDDDLLPLRSDSLPAYFGTQLYVPADVFTMYLGLRSGYERFSDRLYIYRDSKRLDFYIVSQATYDENGTRYRDLPARYVGNSLFLPVDLVCGHFGFNWSLTPSEPASVLRITTSAAVTNDRTFIGLNREAMLRAYTEYYAAPEPTPTPPAVNPPPTYENVTLYLSFYNLDEENTRRVLDELEYHGARGCFFFTADEIAAAPALARETAGRGHSLGVWLEDGTEEEFLRASRLLFEAAKKTAVLIASGAGAEQAARETAEEYGVIYRGNAANYDPSNPSRRLPTAANMRAELRMQCTAANARSLGGAMNLLRERRYTISVITETSPAVNYY